MDKKEEKRNKEEATWEKLQLLEGMMKQHEWAVFGQKEAEAVERTEAELDSEASN
jgi:tellurite resistance-related uncharacterized protein